MKIRRYNATLIEVVIAMALAATLMAALLGYYWTMSRANALASSQRQEATAVRYVQQRLASVIESATLDTDNNPSEIGKSKKLSCFFSTTYNSSESLVFTFDNGNDAIPAFSNNVLARIYLDDGALMMAIWPQPRDEKKHETAMMKKEVLLRDVGDIQFSFFSPPTSDSLKGLLPAMPLSEGHETLAPYPGIWYSHSNGASDLFRNGWEKRFNMLPPLVKVSITMETPLVSFPQTISFAFQIPDSKKSSVIYWEGI